MKNFKDLIRLAIPFVVDYLVDLFKKKAKIEVPTGNNAIRTPTFTLNRFQMTDHSTIGKLNINGSIYYTLELPYLHNKNNVSCIPTGVYECELYMSSQHGKTYIVKDVPNRRGILFHVGNYPKDTEGCILLGTGYRDDMVTNSKKAFKSFMDNLNGIRHFKLGVFE